MSSTEVVVVTGSPREKGNSATLAHRTAEGARSAGARVEVFYLHGMDIRPCDACDLCRQDSGLDCVIDDDMTELYPRLRRAHALVIASPIYWFTVSAQTKLFMDRCYALGGPQGNALRGKRAGVLLTYGDSDPFNSGAVNAIRTFQDAFAYVGVDLVGVVYGSASEPGEIASNRAVMDQAYRLGEELGKQ